jgi:bacteriocin-like protein
MSANSTIQNVQQLSDNELDAVSGGDTLIAGPVENPALQKAEQELKDAYLKNHPIHLGQPLPTPQVAVPH